MIPLEPQDKQDDRYRRLEPWTTDTGATTGATNDKANTGATGATDTGATGRDDRYWSHDEQQIPEPWTTTNGATNDSRRWYWSHKQQLLEQQPPPPREPQAIDRYWRHHNMSDRY